MQVKNYFLSPELYDYVQQTSVQEPPLLKRLREETAKHPRAEMQIPPEQGQLFRLLVPLLNIRKSLEVGVFTGYSSLAVALAMPEEGRIVACDISEEFTSVARRYWAEAGVAHKIDLRLAPATETLAQLAQQGHAESFDFAFIDADKPGYAAYFELCLPLIRKGGLLAFDNTLYHGSVSDAASQDENTVAIRSFNQLIANDPRVFQALLPMADGLTLAVKR